MVGLSNRSIAGKATTPRHAVICLDGLDGVGKTTIGGALADALGGVFYKTPPEPFDSVRAPINASRDPEARLYFYLAGLLLASAQVSQASRARPVVCDRWLPSTVAYHAAMGVEIPSWVRAGEHVLKPDATIRVVIDEAERLRRIAARAKNPRDDHRWESDPAFMARVEHEFWLLRLVEVDVTGLSVRDAVARLLRHIPQAAQAAARC